jgi:hypothetical protein
MGAQLSHSTGVTIRQVFIENLDRDIPGLEGFSYCLVVFRLKGAVVGTAWFQVMNGKVSTAQLQSVGSEIAWPVWQQMTSQLKQPPPDTNRHGSSLHATASELAAPRALAKLVGQGHQVLVVDNCPSMTAPAGWSPVIQGSRRL